MPRPANYDKILEFFCPRRPDFPAVPCRFFRVIYSKTADFTEVFDAKHLKKAAYMK